MSFFPSLSLSLSAQAVLLAQQAKKKREEDGGSANGDGSAAAGGGGGEGGLENTNLNPAQQRAAIEQRHRDMLAKNPAAFSTRRDDSDDGRDDYDRRRSGRSYAFPSPPPAEPPGG